MSFSRLELAAALIEYDNDEKTPYERKDARQSAIFNARRPVQPSNAYATTSEHGRHLSSTDQYGLPGTPRQSSHARQSMMSTGSRYDSSLPMDKKRGTMMTVGSGFQDDDDAMENLDQEEPHGEVDLASWGIPEAFLDKKPGDRHTSGSIGRSARPNASSHRTQSVRAVSIIGMEPLKDDSDPLRPLSPSVQDAISSMSTIGANVDFSDRAAVPRAPAIRAGGSSRRARTVSFHEFSVPQDDFAAEDPRPEDIARPGSSMSVLSRGRFEHPVFDNVETAQGQMTSGRKSSASMEYPLNVPLPVSPGSVRGQVEHLYLDTPEEELPNPFSLPAPAGGRVSRFDPKAASHQRSMSQSSYGPERPDSRATGYFRPADGANEQRSPGGPTSPRDPQVRLSLLRPKTLLMPTPLQGQADPSNSAPSSSVDKRGFLAGQRPLPPGAVRPDSLLGSLPTLRSSNALSLSQKMFSDSLTVDGAKGQYFLGGAAADGEVAFRRIGGRPEEVGESERDLIREQGGTEDWRPVRPVSGLSLMDKLEERKAAQQGKRRVFEGDSRPTMMSRDSTSRHTLVNFAGHDPMLSPQRTRDSQIPARPGNDKHRSVFGVDQVWQKEVAKLRREEEAERAANEQVNGKRELSMPSAQDFELDGEPQASYDETNDEEVYNMPLLAGGLSTSNSMPVLPPIATDTEAHGQKPLAIDDWGASDDENPRPRSKNRRAKRVARKEQSTLRKESGASSDEDVPLAKAFNVKVRPPRQREEDSSSEDVPLAKIVAKSKPPVLPTIVPVSEAQNDEANEEDDDVPLAVRRMTMMSARPTTTNLENDDEDDDVPLAQKRQSVAQGQYYQQQQNQQPFNAMAFQQPMFTNPMQPNFGMPAMGMPMMGMPMMDPYMGMNPSMMSLGQFQPPQDPAIDRWRRAVELKEGSAAGSVIGGQPSAVPSQRS